MPKLLAEPKYSQRIGPRAALRCGALCVLFVPPRNEPYASPYGDHGAWWIATVAAVGSRILAAQTADGTITRDTGPGGPRTFALSGDSHNGRSLRARALWRDHSGSPYRSFDAIRSAVAEYVR